MNTVLVIGASGDIGSAIVLDLLKQGQRVIAQCYRHSERLEQVRNEADANQNQFTILTADLTDADKRKAFMAAVAAQTDVLHGLVNVIGGGRPCSIRDLALEDWESSLALNLTAPFHCLQLAIPLLERGKGSVINFSSVASYTGGAFGPHYAATKSAIIGLTRSAARELGPVGIRVNTIAPGPVDTEMTHSLPPEVMAKILQETPLRRMVSTEEISRAVHYLLGQATSTTGQSLVIDGGRYFH
jgi:NAD(P)-dependent dehydrogenase (short-subunit alcohol dehydrogenase family)